MYFENLFNQFSKDEKLVKEINDKIHKQKFDLEEFTRYFKLDVGSDKTIQKEVIFVKYLKIRVTIQHYMNVYYNNEYYNKMSKNLIIDPIQLTDHNKIYSQIEQNGNESSSLVYLLLQYTILYNLLFKENITKKRPLKCGYCDNYFQESDLKCSVCDGLIDDTVHTDIVFVEDISQKNNHTTDQLSNTKGSIIEQGYQSLEDDTSNNVYEEEISSGYSDMSHYIIHKESLLNNGSVKEDIRVDINEEEKLTPYNEQIFFEREKVFVKCSFCDDIGKCDVCGLNPVEQSSVINKGGLENDKKDYTKETKRNITFRKNKECRMYKEDEEGLKTKLDLDIVEGDIITNVTGKNDGDSIDLEFNEGEIVEDSDKKVKDFTADDFWICNRCTYKQKVSSNKCDVCLNERCGRINDVLDTWECLSCGSNNLLKVKTCVCNHPAPFFDKWVCDKCHFYNNKTMKKCNACDNQKTDLMQSKTTKSKKPKNDKNNWICKSPGCNTINKNKDKHCKKCGLKKILKR